MVTTITTITTIRQEKNRKTEGKGKCTDESKRKHGSNKFAFL